MVVRKTKTDRRDARHLRDLLKDDRFPGVWIPDPMTRDLRALIKHRLRLVRIRTMVKNGLHAIALNQRLALGPSLWSRQGLAQLQALVRLPHTYRRRDDSLALLHWLNGHIDTLDLQVATAAAADPAARRLMTHPGVGPLTALATVLVLGPVARFPGSKHVVSYIGLAPAVNASADKYRLGHISKQGSAPESAVLRTGSSAEQGLEPVQGLELPDLLRSRGGGGGRLLLPRSWLVLRPARRDIPPCRLSPPVFSAPHSPSLLLLGSLFQPGAESIQRGGVRRRRKKTERIDRMTREQRRPNKCQRVNIKRSQTVTGRRW